MRNVKSERWNLFGRAPGECITNHARCPMFMADRDKTAGANREPSLQQTSKERDSHHCSRPGMAHRGGLGSVALVTLVLGRQAIHVAGSSAVVKNYRLSKHTSCRAGHLNIHRHELRRDDICVVVVVRRDALDKEPPSGDVEGRHGPPVLSLRRCVRANTALSTNHLYRAPPFSDTIIPPDKP